MAFELNGVTPVTDASLKVKDRRVMPPDRPLFKYVIKDGTDGEKEVKGNWGDYLRDLDSGLVIESNAPIDDEHNTENAMLITDFYQGIPDRVHILDPLLPY